MGIILYWLPVRPADYYFADTALVNTFFISTLFLFLPN